MNTYEIRRLNLDNIIGDTGRRGRIADFARTHNLDPSFLSQLLNRNRNFGEKAAREMEVQIGLPTGTLDKPFSGSTNLNQYSPGEVVPNLEAQEFLELYKNAPDHLRQAALHILKIPLGQLDSQPNEKQK